MSDDRIFVGAAPQAGADSQTQNLWLALANRHGLITGATGTGKTVTLQVLAEGFSDNGVPVFAADIKGDLSGLAVKGEEKDVLTQRAQDVGLQDYVFKNHPTVLWDLFGVQGHPIRTTVSDMGPLLLARILNLNDTQEGVLNIIFTYADDNGLLLLDLKDLRKVLELIGSDKELQTRLKASYGNVSPATVGAIQRQLLVLEQQGADQFFGEPALQIQDLIATRPDGRGVINLLAADRLMNAPRLYATFLLWLLSELFEDLPEVGDLKKPKLVFFFDEAHLLFSEAPPALLEKIEQVVRLIRSKGVGVYFVTQNPLDIPDKVSAQLGNRVQHALRAYTPLEQKAVNAAASTFRQNPALDTAQVITQLGKGEALVSFLEGNGTPAIVQRTLICPPAGRIGALSADERQQVIDTSPLQGTYEDVADRESAFELLAQRAEVRQAQADEDQKQAANGGGFWSTIATGGGTGPRGGRAPRMGMGETIAKSVARSVATTVGRQIATSVIRGVFGSMLRR